MTEVLSSKKSEQRRIYPLAETLRVNDDDERQLKLSALQAMRTIYVKKMDWPLDKSGIDRDDYDYNPLTTHFYHQIEDQYLSTMRLTSVESLDGLKSLQMMSSNRQMMEDAKQSLAQMMADAPGTKLYDLTRLVFDESVDIRYKVDLLMGLFVPAMIQTAHPDVDGSDEVVWAFAVTNDMFKALKVAGVDCSILAKGVVSPEDGYETVFGYVKPLEATKTALAENSRRYAKAKEAILHGLASKNSL